MMERSRSEFVQISMDLEPGGPKTYGTDPHPQHWPRQSINLSPTTGDVPNTEEIIIRYGTKQRE